MPPRKYCENLFEYHRRKTQEVMVGDVGIGGGHPIRVQSMTIADTMDTKTTVQEVLQLVEAGCEIVRITAPSLREAENLKNIRGELNKSNITVPLVADIHYTPNAALIAADYVEKVRINPGNYADKKKFEQREYTDVEYELELERIEEKFKPLVLKCKLLGRAMRIGTNHGSLSDRIMNRYGDTAEGMVESALEFVKICRKYDFHDIVLSMKSSNPQVAIQAYRLLAARMDELGMDYPFHLGVTEAGDGEEGRIKSAVGIGSLLEDGIGDTIRVSLTEDSVAEVPVAFKLVEKFNRLIEQNNHVSQPINLRKNEKTLQLPHPFWYKRRETMACDLVYHKLGSQELPGVELTLPTPTSDLNLAVSQITEMLGRRPKTGLTLLEQSSSQQADNCETVHTAVESTKDLERLSELKDTLYKHELYIPLAIDFSTFPDKAKAVAAIADRLIFTPELDGSSNEMSEVIKAARLFGKPIEWKLALKDNIQQAYADIDSTLDRILNISQNLDYWNYLFSLSPSDREISIIRPYRYLAGRLDALGANFPILLHFQSQGDLETTILESASQLGSLICDGIGDAIHIEADLPSRDLLRLSYNILQATRLRISKTDYISCPSCGRTLFNLQTTTERIKSKTSHLKGVKIAIMGCIVNGPGEMADADFGYVGAGPKKVNLFVGKECVQRNIPEEQADERLIELIKSHGRWTPISSSEK